MTGATPHTKHLDKVPLDVNHTPLPEQQLAATPSQHIEKIRKNNKIINTATKPPQKKPSKTPIKMTNSIYDVNATNTIVKIGNKKLIHQSTLLIPAGEDAKISFTLMEDTISYRIKLVDNKDNSERRLAESGPDPDGPGGLLTLTNWNSIEPELLKAAPFVNLKVEESDSDGSNAREIDVNLCISAIISRVENIHHVCVQFTMEALP